MADPNPWMLPKISDYLNPQTDAVQRFADKLEISPNPERDLKEIREAVSEHTKVLPLKWLLTASWLIADDLYKTGNSLSLWAEQHGQYIQASAGTFFQRFQEKGFVLRYGINNSFEQTDFGMQRPLHLLPALFAAAGLVYVCPETLSLDLMKHDGIPSSQFLKTYGRYETESRHVALDLLKKCNQMRKSYIVLELSDHKELLSEISADSDSETNAVTVFRSEPPIAGSNVSVKLPENVDWPKKESS
jgi:hypothetical protein